MEFYLNNRQVIKDLAVNTGTSDTPVFTPMCTTSEIEFTTDFEAKDFFVFCDAIKRSVITGATLSLDATVKIDINNAAIQKIFANLHTLITSGEVAQYNNILVQVDILETITNDVLTYKKYQVPVNMKFSDLGGAAEDEGEFALELAINGKGTIVT